MTSLQFEFHLGDASEVMSAMDSETVDFIFADPPYHLSNGGLSVQSGKAVSVNKGSWDRSAGVDEDYAFHFKWLSAAKDVLKPNGTLMVSGTYHSIYRCGFALEQLGFRILNEIVWFKPNAAPNLTGRNFAASHETIIWASKSKDSKHLYNYSQMKEYSAPTDQLKNPGKQMRDVWSIPTTPMREKTFGKHPTQKPVELLRRIISATTEPGQTVLDPFVGSGTTGVAAIELNRSFIGIDLNPEFLELARERIHNLGEKND